MAIRGFSEAQLGALLLTESLGLTIFSIALGAGVGLVMLRGETVVYNAVQSAVLQRRIVFSISAQMTLVFVVGLLIISTVTPILLAVRRVSNNLTWRIME